MRKTLTIVFGIAFIGLSFHAYAVDWPTVEKEGKAWLSKFTTEPPAVNVGGVWYSKSWGEVILVQREGDPEVTGIGDKWGINGIVSGKTAFLIFSGQGVIEYSAVLVMQDPQKLEGAYSRGLKEEDDKGKKMLLAKR
jgi:hypothetical protein